MRLNREVPSRLEDLIMKALEKDRGLRYQTASELKTDLMRLKRDSDSHAAASHGISDGSSRFDNPADLDRHVLRCCLRSRSWSAC